MHKPCTSHAQTMHTGRALVLSQAQREAFARQGWLVVEDVLGPDILDPVRAEYAELLDQMYWAWLDAGLVPDVTGFEARLIAAYRAGCDWFQPMDISLPGDRITTDTPMHCGAAVFDMITATRLLDLVQDLIGPEITSNPIQHVRIKPPAADMRADEVRAHVTSTDWHQDRAVALEEADATEMVTIWIAMTDATPENGCLKVQSLGPEPQMLPHCPKTQTAIADGWIDEAGAVPLPVKAGGVVVLHPLVPHASLPNRTDGIRWSFDLRYNVTGQPTGRRHFPEFIARSAKAPGIALRDPHVWRTMWEEARDQLAAQPHIDIHRWTSDAPFCA